MDKSEIINQIIKDNDYKSYLEIGTQNAKNFKAIECETKHGVDPNVCSPYNVQLTSDEFFEKHTGTYDVIFIDGDHEAKQVKRDIVNSLLYLNKGGAIILHDTIPQSEEMQEVPRQQKVWTGNVWRAVLGFLEANPKVKFHTYRSDWGLTVIYPDSANLYFELTKITYEEFKKNEVQLLNIID